MKQIIKQIATFFKFLFKPSFWMMNERYDDAWDVKLNELLDNVTSLELYFNKMSNEYLDCKINGVSVWIGNYPYGFGGYGMGWNGRPSRDTILRLKKFIDTEIAKQPTPKYAWDK